MPANITRSIKVTGSSVGFKFEDLVALVDAGTEMGAAPESTVSLHVTQPGPPYGGGESTLTLTPPESTVSLHVTQPDPPYGGGQSTLTLTVDA